MNTAARLSVPLAAVLTGALAQPAAAAPKLPPMRIAATEVSFRNAKVEHAAAMSDALVAASAAESGYYDPALPAATMRIHIDKVGFKSAGKAVAQNLPLVGMFSGPNENVMKGEVQLVDQASGKVLAKYKIRGDDYTDVATADAAAEYGKIGMSFLPFGGLLSAAVEVGEGAANKRDAAERMLTRGFVMLSYQKVYGSKLYRSFSPQRKAAFAADRPAATPAPARVAAATPQAR